MNASPEQMLAQLGMRELAPGAGQAANGAADDREFAPVVDHQQEQPAPVPPLLIASPSTLRGSPPPRQWIVREWLPAGVVTGLYGDGGLGKSLLAQQLQTACALGLPWLGLPCERTPSLAAYCEDSLDELHRRQADINLSYSCDFDALTDTHWLARLGEDNLLMTFGRNGVGELTAFHKLLLSAALDLRARLVIVDTAADVFGGNENDRNHVRQFVSRALGSIATKINGAVLLCAHPSRSGLASGEGDGGSTGWNNALRSRLFLRAPGLEDGEAPDQNARVLQRRKANYAARQDELRLRWTNGTIEPEASTKGSSPFGRRSVEDVFLALLDGFETAKRNVSSNSRSGNYAPREFGKAPKAERDDYRAPHFEHAMSALFSRQEIELTEYGRPSNPVYKIVRARKNEA